MAYYDGSDVKRIQAAQSLLHSFLTQKVIKTGDETYEQTFADIALPFLEKCETNLTETHLKQIGGIFSKVSANAIKYYRFNGTEQYLEKYYLVYNEMCTDLTSSAVQESSIVMKEYFKTN